MASDQLVIHVRFFNDGSVAEIGERPRHVSAQLWFDQLTAVFADRYLTLSGGRGVFRLSREAFDGALAIAAQ